MRESFAPGKIILSGEYAVVFGYPGIAIPSTSGIRAIFEENLALGHIEFNWNTARQDKRLYNYTEKIIALCAKFRPELSGTIKIDSSLPIAKGMGSSSALVIAIARAILGENAHEETLSIEDTLSPQHSGLDFTVIWENNPVYFKKGTEPKPFTLPTELLRGAAIIDTGRPNETTTELVDWMKTHSDEMREHLEIIGKCAERIIAGDDFLEVMRIHHAAQKSLGVVTESVSELIAEIEKSGGAAKVIGAGGRTGGSGMVLAFAQEDDMLQTLTDERHLPVTFL